MNPDKCHRRDGHATRERILTAAARRFATQSYEATGLRDIALDVGVDVALVHRAFGSKAKLFVAALSHAVQPASLVETLRPDRGMDYALRAFEDDVQQKSVADPLALLLRSIASPQALPLIREFTTTELLSPLAEQMKKPSALRAALIAACIVGIRLFRDVLEVEVMNDANRPQMELIIAEMFDLLLSESTADI